MSLSKKLGLVESSILVSSSGSCLTKVWRCSGRDRPELVDKPVAVGGESMISTTNYHARKWGVRSAMPGFIGRKLCPQLVFIRPDFEK